MKGLQTFNPELELMEREEPSIGYSEEIQSMCPCRCHPRCRACVRCNVPFHNLPFPHHTPENYNPETGGYDA